MRSALAALTTVAALLLAAPAFAKLPPLSDEAKAKAAETAAKAGWTDKVGAYKLCRAMERTAMYYRASPKSASAPAAVETPACADPGPYVAAVQAPTPPIEASGAHSPATMATSPPGSKATAAELQGPAPKK